MRCRSTTCFGSRPPASSVHDFSSFLERETGRVDLDSLNPVLADLLRRLFRRAAHLERRQARCSTSSSSALLLLASRAGHRCSSRSLVKLDSKGPAFYRQRRVGLYGEPFDVIKLRSMRDRRRGRRQARSGRRRTIRASPASAAFIRKVRIDELPQAWTVLKGEMSFVGPRPERPQFVADLEERLPYYAERHVVKPGITGWAQINYPYGASVEDARAEARIRSLLRQELHAVPRSADHPADRCGWCSGRRARDDRGRSPCGAICSPPRSTARWRSGSCGAGAATAQGRPLLAAFAAIVGLGDLPRLARPLCSSLAAARRERAQPRLPRLHVRPARQRGRGPRGSARSSGLFAVGRRR